MAIDKDSPEWLFNDIFKSLKDEDTHLAADGTSCAEFDKYVDTGSYAFNALLSGSIYGGFPNNKRLMLAGESSVGKTFFALSILKEYLKGDKWRYAHYLDTEASVTKQMLIDREISPLRVIKNEANTIEKIRTHLLKTITEHKERVAKNDKLQCVVIYDSLGNTSSAKELGDIEAGSETKDMTKPALFKALFRAVTIPMARAKMPFIIINHVYANMTNPYASAGLSGGSGSRYAADIITYLSKAKDRDDKTKELLGNIITARLEKSRLTKEGSSVKLKLSHRTGLDKYYGLVDIAIKGGVFKKVSTKIELPDGTTQFEKTIYNNPEKYFTKEVLDAIDKAAANIFNYGDNEEVPVIDVEKELEVTPEDLIETSDE